MATKSDNKSQSKSSGAMGGAKEWAQNEASSLTGLASGAKEAARSKASEMTSGLRQQAMSQGENIKQQTTESLRSFAEAIRAASDELASKDQSMAANMVRQAATGLETLSDTLGRQSPSEMIDSVRQFGRRNPTVFIAGSVLAGLALGRFIASSSKPRESQQFGADDMSGDDMSGDMYGGDTSFGAGMGTQSFGGSRPEGQYLQGTDMPGGSAGLGGSSGSGSPNLGGTGGMAGSGQQYGSDFSEGQQSSSDPLAQESSDPFAELAGLSEKQDEDESSIDRNTSVLGGNRE